LFLLLISLFLLHAGLSQGCLPQGITFSRQAQIDSFQINYPNCTHILGNVKITGTDSINNLNGLSVLTSIGGYLQILDWFPNLTQLTGLNSLTSIGGDLWINSTYLTNLSGLNALTSIGGNFSITHCNSMTNLSGIASLTSVGGFVNITANYFSLKSLTGLESLSSIQGELYITGNNELSSLSGLSGLSSIRGRLTIQYNDSLSSLSGLNNIAASSIDSLVIIVNPSLTTCEVQSVCAYLANPGGTIEIHDNATGCNNQQEVEAACSAIGVQNITNESPFSLYPNPASTIITIETSTLPTQSQVTVSNLEGQELITLQISGHKTKIDINTLSNGIYFVRLTSDKTLATGKFIKQ
ncbi:MAG: T9SS type A sorting domain-containing protein, partial [Bacteroidetes bacterium]|nr:T9SS type A sorting domain-containing protein [Bacteroidota bacterium]